MNVDMVLALDALFQRNRARTRQPRNTRIRCDPQTSLSDYEFKRTFRFRKDSVDYIVGWLGNALEFPTDRGLPVSPTQQVCIALNHYAGGQFQRVTGMCGGVSQGGARMSLVRVTDAIVEKKDEFIKMPTKAECEETALRMKEKFGLPRFAYAVDGTLARFSEAPRRLPPNKHKQQFWSRKQCYAINVQAIGNDRLIYDLDVGWPGSTHDARIWKRSEAKSYLEEEGGPFYIVGDSGYPISEMLMKPYTTEEAANNRQRKKFNAKLSGMRTMMSECLYGVWKRRFPIIKSLRTDFLLSQKIIIATAVLFNIARILGDEDFEEEDLDEDNEENGAVENNLGRDGVGNNEAAIRFRGQVERDRLFQEWIDGQ